MFKEIAITIFSLVTSPGSTWKKVLGKEEDQDTFLSRFVYPLMGITALAVFVSFLLTRATFDLQEALKEMMTILVSLFLGFFSASFLLNEMMIRFFEQTPDLKLVQRFSGYALSFTMAVTIIVYLLPDFSFLRFAPLYTFYIAWEGSKYYLNITDKKRIRFTIFSTLILLLSPEIIKYVMFLIMPGIKI